MNKVRVLKRNDGGVSVVYPISKSKRPGETEEQWLERVFAKANPNNLPYVDIDQSELPQDREDRNAWELDDKEKKVKINPVKARQIKEEKLIKEEMAKIGNDEKRDQAIANLKAQGKIE